MIVLKTKARMFSYCHCRLLVPDATALPAASHLHRETGHDVPTPCLALKAFITFLLSPEAPQSPAVIRFSKRHSARFLSMTSKQKF